MKKTGVFIVCNVSSTFAANIEFKIEKGEIKNLYEDTINTLNIYGFNEIFFKVNSTICIHPYIDYATSFSLINNDKNSNDDELNFYWNGGYRKYFEYDINKFISYNYDDLKNLNITVKEIKTANIEYSTSKYSTNNAYKNAISEIKTNLFKGKDYGFIILRDHYNAYINCKYPFLSVDYDDKKNTLIVKCDDKKINEHLKEELYYTIKLKIPEKVINDNIAKNIILQYKKEDLEKIEIKIYSKSALKLNDIKVKAIDDLKKRNIPISVDFHLFDKNSKVTSGDNITKGDYTFYSDDLFIKEVYKKKSDELKDQVNKMNNFSSKIHDLEIEKITDKETKETLIKTLYQGMKNIAEICNNYSNDKIVNDKKLENLNGRELMYCDDFKEKMLNNFKYLANIYVFLSTITYTEDVIEKIKKGDISFDVEKKVFCSLTVCPDYYFCNAMNEYKDKVDKLLKGKNLWKGYGKELKKNLTQAEIFIKNKYNKDFCNIYNEKYKLIKNEVLEYYNTKYKELVVKINNESVLKSYVSKYSEFYHYSLKVRPDLSSGVTFNCLKNNSDKLSHLCEAGHYLLSIYDKDGNYIGYGLDTKIPQNNVTFNPALEIRFQKNTYESNLNEFNKMKKEFENKEIKEINAFTGKAADFKNKYKTVLKKTEYLTLSKKEYDEEKKPYYLERFTNYVLGRKDIDGNDVDGSKKIFCSSIDYNISIINEINNAAINKYNDIQKAEMDEEDRKTLSELQTAVENSKNEILGVINSANDLEKIKDYSTIEKIKVELEKAVKNKVADYDTKKAKFVTIDLFTNPVDEIEKVYKTKENAILEEKLKQQQLSKEKLSEEDKPTEEPEKEEEEKVKTTEVQNTTNGTKQKNTKCSNYKKDVQ